MANLHPQFPLHRLGGHVLAERGDAPQIQRVKDSVRIPQTKAQVNSFRVLFTLGIVAAAACGGTSDSGNAADAASGSAVAEPQLAFLASLNAMCGQSFEGRVVENEPPSDAFVGKVLVMHVRECSDSAIRIPFHVGEDRSRTWVITTTATGLRLKHDHRHEDGKPDSVTQYGGDTNGPGSAVRQEFPADAYTGSLIPASATNVWTVEVDAGKTFAYALRRDINNRRFRVEFDLTRPVATPPAPWE